MNAPEKPTADSCPRCGNLFTCSASSVHNCDCRSLSLTPDDLAYVRAYTERQFGTYSCLCVTCLRELQAEKAATIS